MALKTRNLIQSALVCHVFISLFMFTVPSIFTRRLNMNKWTLADDTFLIPYYVLAPFANIALGADSTRFLSGPAIFYLWGAGIFVIVVFIEYWFGFFKRCLNSKRCCIRKYMSTETAFSYDIYEDLHVDGLKLEYDKTCLMINEYTQLGDSTDLPVEDKNILAAF